jgi:hypothetical protein
LKKYIESKRTKNGVFQNRALRRILGLMAEKATGLRKLLAKSEPP